MYSSKTYVGWDDIGFVCNGGLRHTETRLEVGTKGFGGASGDRFTEFRQLRTNPFR